MTNDETSPNAQMTKESIKLQFYHSDFVIHLSLDIRYWSF
jgi:hypothetical protein